MFPLYLTIAGSLCLILPSTEAGLVSCFSGLDHDTGTCTDLIGHGIEEGDCCLNIVYCYQPEHGGESQSCRPSAVWTEWSDWSPCTVSCREGVQQRRRRCIGKGRCPGNERLQTRSCVEKDCCPVAGGWSAWSPWGPCSVTCAIGNKERFRTCSEPPPACGGNCPGSTQQTLPCVLQDICPTHGSWSLWGNWGSCLGSCQEEGGSLAPRRRRNRTCTNPTPSFDPPGEPCPGADANFGLCDFLPFCPIAGNWGSWAKISQCSVSCGIGTIRQMRACESPPPKHGGPDCSGIRSRDVPCNTGLPCPVDGVWTNWGQWSFCARTGWNISCKMFMGQQRRTRHCQGRNHGGEPCLGSIIEVRTCYDSDNCWYGKGVWSDWSNWGLCHPPCGEDSTRSRSRVCEPVYPDYLMRRGITKKANISFSGYPIFECDELEGEHETLQEYRPCQNVPLCD